MDLFKTTIQANHNIDQFWMSYISTLINKCQFDNAKQTLKKAKRKGLSRDKLNILNQQLLGEINPVEPITPRINFKKDLNTHV